MKTKEELKREATLKVDALDDVRKSLESIEEEVEFDPSLRAVMNCEAAGAECTVGYGVADDDLCLVRISIGKDGNESYVTMNRDAALKFAADIIAFAMHLGEMNGDDFCYWQ